MIIDTHTHVVSSDKRQHPLDPGARGWSTEVSNDVEGLDHGMGHLATLRPEKNERLPPIKVETKGRPHHP